MKSEIILLKSKNEVDACKVLSNHGFITVSNYWNDNIFEKNGELYKISHPVWTRDFSRVRVEKIRKDSKRN